MNSKRQLKKWKKLFDQGFEIEVKYRVARYRDYPWQLIRHWNIEDYPEYKFYFRKRKL